MGDPQDIEWLRCVAGSRLPEGATFAPLVPDRPSSWTDEDEALLCARVVLGS